MGTSKKSRRRTNAINNFARKAIRRLRIARGIRVQDMADRTGIPLGSYSCLETGYYRINLENLSRIVHVLGVPVTEVFPTLPGEPQAVEKVSEASISEYLEMAAIRQPQAVTYNAILAVVRRLFAVKMKDLSSPSRRRELARARTVATVLVKEQPHLTMVGLSRRLRRHVSSLSHCLRRLEYRLRDDHELQEIIDRAREQLLPGEQLISVDDVLELAAQSYDLSSAEIAGDPGHGNIRRARMAAALVVEHVPHLQMADLTERMGRSVRMLTSDRAEAGNLGEDFQRRVEAIRHQVNILARSRKGRGSTTRSRVRSK